MMKKETIMPIAVLTVICVIVAALLGAVNLLTRDKIAENALKKEQASLIEVMPDASTFEEIEKPQDAPATVKTVYRETKGLGYVFIMVAEKTDYSSGDMTISVGISDGKIVGSKITSYSESKDLGKTTYPEKYVGKTDADYEKVELVSGVTFSSTAFRNAIGDALRCEALLREAETVSLSYSFPEYLSGGETLPKTDAELSALIAELVPGASVTAAAIPEGSDATLKRLWSVDKGGYVLYLVVPGAYVPVATEALVYVDANGEIANINLLSWVVGHGVVAGDFAEGFIGSDILNIGDVELVSGATGTAKDFRNAAASSVKIASELMNLQLLQFEGMISELVSGSAVTSESVPAEADATLKHLWSVQSGGYVLHLVVPGAYVPVATEALVYVDANGEIANINLLNWIVGHGVGPGDFANGFIGANVYEIDDVELVSGATGTAKDFRDAASSALKIATDLMNLQNALFEEMVSELAGGSPLTKETVPAEADPTLKDLWSVEKGGYVLHLVVPGAYVPVATEAIIYVNGYGEIEGIKLLEWIVGHGVDAGDFAEGFIGTNVFNVGNVELVSGATGTAKDFRNAAVNAVSLVSAYMEEAIMQKLVDETAPFAREFEKMELPENAPSTLKALYSAKNGRGTVAHIVVPGAYVPVASNALVYFNEYGEIKGVTILEWIVGHGIGPGDFADRLIDSSEETIGEVELVSGCTGTSGDLRSAIADAYEVIPARSTAIRTAIRIAAGAVIILSISALAAYLVISKKRRTAE